MSKILFLFFLITLSLEQGEKVANQTAKKSKKGKSKKSDKLKKKDKLTKVDNLTNIENITLVDNLTKLDNLTKADNLTKDENLTKVDNLTKLENITKADNLTKLNNLTKVDNLTKDENPTKVDNLTKLGNLTKVDNVTKEENLTKVDNFTKLGNLTKVDNVTKDENLTKVDNLTKIDNLTKVDNLTNIENITIVDNLTKLDNLTKVDNVTKDENLTKVDNLTKIGNLTKVDNITKLDNLTKLDNVTKDENLIKIDNNITKVENLNIIGNISKVYNTSQVNDIINTNNLTKVANLTETDNFTNVKNLNKTDNLTKIDNLAKVDTKVGNFTNTTNLNETENITKVDNLTKADNLTKIDNITKIDNLTKPDNFTGSDNFTKLDNLTQDNITKKTLLNITRPDRLPNISYHNENCFNTSRCKKGFTCYLHRCLTQFEIDNIYTLGLNESNVCNSKLECAKGKNCIKFRCVDKNEQLDLPRRKKKNDSSINLLFAGSIFLNNKAYKSGEKEKNKFNYKHLFKNIKKEIKNANLAIVDQETIFQTNKTNFEKRVGNTPEELGDAIADAGFKLVLHGTKYAYAKEKKGIKNTLNFWKDKYPDIKILGISKNEENSKKNYFKYKKNGIKIGIINFSGFPDLIPKDKEYMVNVISEKKIKNFVGKMKNETDFVIVCMNWGEKTADKPDEDQIKWAKKLTAEGVRLIIGNHPSVVQPVSYIKSKGKKALVFWSLGHLISDSKVNMSYISALADIEISKGPTGKAFVSNYNLIPLINHKVDNKNYSVYKISDYTEELGKEVSENFNMSCLLEECGKLMGPFV